MHQTWIKILVFVVIYTSNQTLEKWHKKITHALLMYKLSRNRFINTMFKKMLSNLIEIIYFKQTMPKTDQVS